VGRNPCTGSEREKHVDDDDDDDDERNIQDTRTFQSNELRDMGCTWQRCMESTGLRREHKQGERQAEGEADSC